MIFFYALYSKYTIFHGEKKILEVKSSHGDKRISEVKNSHGEKRIDIRSQGFSR